MTVIGSGKMDCSNASVQQIPKYEPVTHDQAQEAANRFVNWWFQNKGKQPRVSIPARPDHDDDLLLTRYICEQREKESK